MTLFIQTTDFKRLPNEFENFYAIISTLTNNEW